MVEDSERTALYRHHGADGELLYVGISRNPFTRMDSHTHESNWMSSVKNMSVQWFDTRRAALDAEAIAIQNENPIHNIQRPVPSFDYAVPPAPSPEVEVEFYTIEECAARLQIDPELLYDEIANMQLRCVTIGTEKRISIKAFQTFIKRKESVAKKYDGDDEVMRMFVYSMCDVDTGLLTPVVDLYDYYVGYMECEPDHKIFMIGEFSKRMNAMGYRSIRIRGKRYKQGISRRDNYNELSQQNILKN